MTEKPIHLESREMTGAKLYSPSAARNRQPIADILIKELPKNARVLEIASGTGEHAAFFCSLRDDIVWQPSDPDQTSRESQNAWAVETANRVLPSIEIDTTVKAWWNNLGIFDAIYCANMIHIAPWDAAIGLARGAGKLLRKNGKVFLYGPFKEGEHTAPSNLEFDANLKKRDPDWGVRDLDSVKHIFADVGLKSVARIVMPKENRMLIFSN